MTLIQQITTEANIASAWQKVRTNMGAPGVDRVSVEEYENNLHENLALLRNCVSDGTYTPLPYLSFTQKKESGKERNLNILSVRDRVAQQAIHQVLVPIYEKIFHNCSYAYRPGKSTFKAIERL